MWLDTFRDFLLVSGKQGRPIAPSTVRNYVDALRRLERDYQFNPQLFLTTKEAAKTEGTRVLARLRVDRPNPNAFNLGQKSLNALARSAGLDVHWKKQKPPTTQPKPFTRDELRKLLNYRSNRRGWARKEETSRRRALLWFAIKTAMRHGEIHRTKTSHLDPVGNHYTIHHPSKDGPPRTLPVEAELYSTGRPFMPWVHAHPIDPRDTDALWTTEVGRRSRGRKLSRRDTPRRLTYHQLGKELHDMGRAVGVEANFYRTRATRATDLKRAGAGDRTIQVVLGHTKLETTVHYVQHTLMDVADDLRRHRPKSPFQNRKE